MEIKEQNKWWHWLSIIRVDWYMNVLDDSDFLVQTQSIIKTLLRGGRNRSMGLFCWIDEVCNADSVHSIISGSSLREITSLCKKITNLSRCAAYFFCCRIMTIQFLKGAIVQKLTPSFLSHVQLCQTHLWRLLHAPPARYCWWDGIPDVHARGGLMVQNLKMGLMRINLANFGFTFFSKLEKNSGIK